ncbi:hypothetical protein [Glaciecola sp. 1036]|uniref:hypothetical protein n=1 Tax=Alteromonadaceae TaxID=72275 RepID=UPI003D022664
MENIRKISIGLIVFTLIFIQACGSTSNSNGKDEGLGFTMKALLCSAGGVAGAYVGKTLAQKYFEKSDKAYTAKEIDTYTKGFQVGLFLTFCAITNYAGETIYKKLSEAGQEKRRQQVLQAAITSETTTYADPSNPNIRGVVEPIDRYTEDDGEKECVVTRDTLTVDQSSEAILTTLCREPNGEYQIVAV